MKKKILSALLIGTMAASLLAGCGGSSSGGASDGGSETATSGAEASEEASSDLAQQAIDERLASGENTKLVMAFFNFVGAPAGLERVTERINEITEPELGIEVEIMIMDSASYSQNMNLMLASGEQVDIFSCCALGFMPCVNKGYLYDLYEDDLIKNYGSGIYDVWDEQAIKACEVSGSLYGIPIKKDDAAGQFGISIPAEYLDEIGYDYASAYENEGDEIIYTDWETIDDIMAKLHEAYPDKTTFYMDPTSIVSQCLEVDGIGGDYFGALCDPFNSLEVTNLFEDQQYIDLCKKMYEYNQLGYISKDAMTETNATTTQIASGSLCAYKTATKPGIKQQETGLCKTPVIIFQLGNDMKKSTCYNTMPWAMNSQTEDPIAAMQLLEAFYTDSRLSTLLCWGEEGVEYVYTDDGHITFPEGLTAEQSEYYNNVNWETPNQFIAPVFEGDSLDLWERMESFNDNALTTKALGFTWDNTDYANEFAALTNVYNEYYKQLELGFLDPDKGIPEMVEKLKSAGLEEYMAAKQEALNEWAEANGVS